MTGVRFLFHSPRVGRIKLDSVNELARRGYRARVRCRQCGREREFEALHLMQLLHVRRISLELVVAERHLRCGECRYRGAQILPVPIES